MNLRESVATALDALWANRLRSLLTMLGIIIGVASVIAVVAIGRGGQSLVIGELEGLGSGTIIVQPDWMAYSGDMKRVKYLNPQDLRVMLDMPGVVAASPETDVTVTAKVGGKARDVVAQGVDAAYPSIYPLKLVTGRFFTEAEVKSGVRVAVIGESFEEEFFGAGRGVGRVVRLNGSPFTVIGVAQKSKGLFTSMGALGSMQMFVPYTSIRRVTGENDITVVSVRPAEADLTPEVQASLQEWIDRRYGAKRFKVDSLEQMIAAIRKITSIMTGIIGGIAAIALLVGGIGVMNIMLVSVTERTREIGVRMALGARRRDILRQFLIEAVVLSVTGGLIGMALGGALAAAAGALLKLPPLFTWQSVLLAVSVSAAVGILFGVYPAGRAARLDPVEALRYE